MSESTGSADVAAPAGPAVYLWEVPGKPFSVQVSLDVVERLDREVVQTFRAITSRGSEVGGVLLGRVDRSGKCTIVIEDYEPVACDYRRGPLYLLTEADQRRLAETVARWKGNPNNPRSIVGYYRSNTRKDLILDDDDVSVIGEYFPAPESVFLLIKPFASKPNLAGIFLWENGSVGRQSPQTFLFNRAELAKRISQPAPAGQPAPAARPSEIRPTAPATGRTAAAVASTASVALKESPEAPSRIERAPGEGRPAAVTTPPRPELKPVIAAPPWQRVERPAPSKAERPAAEARQAAPVRQEPPAPAAPPAKPPEKPAAEARPAPMPVRPVPVAKPAQSRPTPASPAKIERPAPPPIPIRPERPAVETRSAAPAPAAPLPEEPRPPAASLATASEPLIALPSFEAAEPSAVSRIAGAIGRLAKNRLVWIAAGLLLLVAVISLFVLGRGGGSGRGAAEDTKSLALKVERDGSQLLLSWNRNASLLQTAERAILSIGDGDHREDVELTLVQLRGGNVVYSPITSDVSFRLEVTDLKNGKSLAESVQVVASKPSPSAPAGQSAPPPQTTAVKPPTTPAPAGTPRPETARPAQLGGGAATPPATDSAATDNNVTPVAQPTRNLTLPTAGGDSLAARLSAPEPMAPAGQAPEVNLPVSSSRPVAPPALTPAEPKPAQPQAQAAKPALPPVAEPSKPGADQPIRVGGAVQEAKLIRRRPVVYPPMARQARLQGTVKLEALIGADGKVEKVDALSGPPLLRQAAIDAVKQYVYQPSMLNGQPVKVQTQIDVIFTLGR